MSAIPLALSIPHAGLSIPPEIRAHSRLTKAEIAADGDVGAAEIFMPMTTAVSAYATTDIARAFLDMNRAVDDRRKDGVVKTHTCWDVRIYRCEPDEAVFAELLTRYYWPYHEELSAFAHNDDVVAAVDCHTMAEFGPPVGPDPGDERPLVCLGNVNGASCSNEWVELLAQYLELEFGETIALNVPFAGGYITRAHGKEMPWIQLEFSRTERFTVEQKRNGLMKALRLWCNELFLRD